MTPVKPVMSAARKSIPENIEYHQFSLNSLVSVRNLMAKLATRES